MSSATSTSGLRVSMFAPKSGFVIPKNKLSGSLVPVFQGDKKRGGSDAGSRQSTNEGQRKTKWGPDLTQDAAVRKARALAYQKRVDQITQLKLGILEVRNNQDSNSGIQSADEKSSYSQLNNEKLELLELERREAIGEILKLNPRYKAPPDYKPLMKETTVPIPVKEYPEYNFVSLILGPGGDTQKRLEKETGTKIQVYGHKANTGEKVEISPPDGNEIQGAYEDLWVKISAETYEKVDTAVAVIELLVTSVSGNLGATSASGIRPGDNSNFASQNKDTVMDVGALEPVGGSTQTLRECRSQYNSPWFPSGSNQTPIHPPFNSSAPILSNPIQVQPSPANSSNTPSRFGHQTGPFLQNPSLPSSSQSPMQALTPPLAPQSHHPIDLSGQPRTFAMPAFAQPNISVTPPFSGNQAHSITPQPPMRPSMPFPPQPLSSFPPRPGPLSDLSLNSIATSTNMGQVTPPMFLNPGPRPVAPQPGNAQPSASLPLSMPMNRPAAPLFSPGLSRPMGPLSMVGPSSTSVSVIPNFTPVSEPAPAAAPRPLHGDFTFRPQISSRPSIQPAPPPNAPPLRSMLQLPAINMTSRPLLQTFSRPQFGNQMGEPRLPHLPSAPFSGYPAAMSGPPRGSAFQNAAPAPLAPALQMRPRNFVPALEMPNVAAPFPRRPVNPVQFQQSYPIPNSKPQNRQFNPSGQQVYDPFSPTDA